MIRLNIRLRAKERTKNINIAQKAKLPKGEIWLFYILCRCSDFQRTAYAVKTYEYQKGGK